MLVVCNASKGKDAEDSKEKGPVSVSISTAAPSKDAVDGKKEAEKPSQFQLLPFTICSVTRA